jgi:hypothetical protein
MNDTKFNEYSLINKSEIVKIIIQIFIIITLLLIVMLAIYYITPNNYSILKLTDNFIIVESKKIIIEPNSEYYLEFSNFKNKYLKFNKINNRISIHAENYLKSQSILYKDDNQLIKLNNNTNIILHNNNNSKQIIEYDILVSSFDVSKEQSSLLTK